MAEEKQHEAAGQQPGTEVLAEERPERAPQVEPGADGGETAFPATAPEPVPETHVSAPSTESVPGEAPFLSDSEAESTAGDSERESESQGADEEVPESAEIAGEEEPDFEAQEVAGFDLESAEDAPLSEGPDSDPERFEASPETSISAFELIGSTEDQATEAETDAATLKAVLEAIVYVLPEPVPAAQMAAALNQPVERVEDILRELMEDTAKPERGVFIRAVAGGYQVATKPEHHEAIRNFVKNLKQPLKLSSAALETLAVIAYKQPVTAPEIMEIRGVQGVGVLKTLLDRKLITTAGRKNVIGKPILYKTTREFLTQFGLNRVSELPTLKEFEEIRRQSMSDDEIEDRPEAHPSAPLLEQAAALDSADVDTPDSAPVTDPGATISFDAAPEESREQLEEPPESNGEAADVVQEPEPHAESDPQPEEPPEPESGPESQENHG